MINDYAKGVMPSADRAVEINFLRRHCHDKDTLRLSEL